MSYWNTNEIHWKYLKYRNFENSYSNWFLRNYGDYFKVNKYSFGGGVNIGDAILDVRENFLEEDLSKKKEEGVGLRLPHTYDEEYINKFHEEFMRSAERDYRSVPDATLIINLINEIRFANMHRLWNKCRDNPNEEYRDCNKSITKKIRNMFSGKGGKRKSNRKTKNHRKNKSKKYRKK
jgi:hypothetical protein